MENRLQAALAAALLTAASAASGEGLTEAQARTLIAPWYGLLNQPVAGGDQSMKVVGNFAKSIPGMKFDIKEVASFITGQVVGVNGGKTAS